MRPGRRDDEAYGYQIVKCWARGRTGTDRKHGLPVLARLARHRCVTVRMLVDRPAALLSAVRGGSTAAAEMIHGNRSNPPSQDSFKEHSEMTAPELNAELQNLIDARFRPDRADADAGAISYSERRHVVGDVESQIS